MNKIKYRELVEFLKGNVFENSKQEIKRLKKESKNFEEKNEVLYRKRIDGKSVRVLKEDEIDTVIFMMHNHPTGGHFGKDTIYNKINTRFW